jgi:hypothetical protein
MSESAAQIIDDKGGPSAVAAKVGRSPGAVRVWKHRDAFPRDAWPEIIGAYPDLTLDRLMKIERSREPETPAPTEGAAA